MNEQIPLPRNIYDLLSWLECIDLFVLGSHEMDVYTTTIPYDRFSVSRMKKVREYNIDSEIGGYTIDITFF